ncbi:MAG: universal stress protein [Hyphomicrobiaceae bacterium]
MSDSPSPTIEKTSAKGEVIAGDDADHRFSILVCLDGSEDSLQALKYAVRVGSGNDADLTLLYVRPIDQGLRTGGLQISVARENLLDWGIELPGMKALKKGRDMLVELGWLGEDWPEEFKHTDVSGDPLGDNMIVYKSDLGRSITLKLMVSPSVVHGILDESDLGQYDLTVLAKPDDPDDLLPGYIDGKIAETVAIEHPGTVLVTKSIEESHGHLVCVTDSEESINAARRDAVIASRCACPVYLISVAADESELEAAERSIVLAEEAIKDAGINVSGKKTVIGDPVETIVSEGRDYSVIVMSAARQKTGWRRFFTTSVAYKVLETAHNSVMIAR